MNDSTTQGQRAEDQAAASNAGAVSGLFRSLTGLIATFIAIARTRLELLTVELQEEVQRAAGLIVWGLVALVVGMMALLLGGLTVVFAYWDTHRVLAALLVTGAFATLALVAAIVFAVKLNSRPRFLDATLSELAKDSQVLQNKLD